MEEREQVFMLTAFYEFIIGSLEGYKTLDKIPEEILLYSLVKLS